MHLLVFDDDERIADIFAAMACDCGWTAAKATSAPAFWTAFHAQVPDAIFLDMRLGVSDGVEQLRLISRQSYTGSVVLMSGVDPRVLVSAKEVGLSLGLAVPAIIAKPACLARVCSVLASLENAARTTVAQADVAADDEVAVPPITPAMVAEAIRTGQMQLHLQPIIAAADQKTIAAEGLVRWVHPVRGLLPPGDFVPIAEHDGGAIDQLTAWVIEAAALQYRELASRGLALPINVNVSGRNLQALDFPDRITALLDRLGVPAEAIGLEVTETVAIEDPRVTADILTRLRLKGISLAIDDFGTGHSTLATLRRMPFSTIKIDRGFVADVLTSRDSFNIVRSIIDLAHTMGLTTVAEGVEDKQVADCLIELGVDALQGFGFARALPLDAFIGWLKVGRD